MAIKTFAEWLAENPSSGSLSLDHRTYLEEMNKPVKAKAEDKPKAKSK